MEAEREGYQKLIDYIEELIVSEKIRVGQKLPSERELSAILKISRGAVRTGLTVLEVIGVVSNRPGSGNYIAASFDHNLVQIMTMMYVLDDMSTRDICGFRYAAELQAIMIAPINISDSQKGLLRSYVNIMLSSRDAGERSYADKMIHQTIVEASGNRLVIANYLALSRLLDRFVSDVRESMENSGRGEYERFQHSHEKLVQGICDGDFRMAREALDEHQAFLLEFIDKQK